MLNERFQQFAKYRIYQIYPRSFLDTNNDGIGDLQGIILKLDYLQNLNINAIWISPFFKSPMVDNGYDIADYLDIDPMFGTMNDFDLLIKEAHKRNIKIIIDLVANHTSTEHNWFKEAIKSKDNPFHNYYYFFDEIPNNWECCFYGSPYEYIPSLKQYYLHSFAVEQADLNWENPAVREEIKKIVDFYVNKGVDGFRCDVLDMVSKDFSNPDGNHNGKNLHKYIKELFGRPHLSNIFTIGECWSTTVDNLKLFIGQDRKELTTSFQGEISNIGKSSVDKFIKESFKYSDIAKGLDKWQKISQEQDILYSLFLENHDTLRTVTRFMSLNADKYMLATMLAMMVYLLRGVTYIYQGQEIGLENPHYDSLNDFNDIETFNYFKDHENLVEQKELLDRINFHSRDNNRRGMCWDDSIYGGFSKVKPWIKEHSNIEDCNVSKDLSSSKSIYKFYSTIMKLRSEQDAFTIGTYKCLELTDKYYIYQRQYNNECFNVVIIFDKETSIDSKYLLGEVVLNNFDDYNNKVFKPFSSLVLKVK